MDYSKLTFRHDALLKKKANDKNQTELFNLPTFTALINS